MALIDLSKTLNAVAFDNCGILELIGFNYVLSIVEIKKSVAASTISTHIPLSTVDLVVCEVGSGTFRKYTSQKHAGKVVKQMLGLEFNVCVLVAATETGIMYKVVGHYSDRILTILRGSLRTVTHTLLQWAYENPFEVPSYDDAESKVILKSQHTFWRFINSRVKATGPLPPVQVLKHGSQSLYSKKGGCEYHRTIALL